MKNLAERLLVEGLSLRKIVGTFDAARKVGAIKISGLRPEAITDADMLYARQKLVRKRMGFEERLKRLARETGTQVKLRASAKRASSAGKSPAGYHFSFSSNVLAEGDYESHMRAIEQMAHSMADVDVERRYKPLEH